MNPRSLIKNIPSKSQQWKAPVKLWIRDMYESVREKLPPAEPPSHSGPRGSDRHRGESL